MSQGTPQNMSLTVTCVEQLSSFDAFLEIFSSVFAVKVVIGPHGAGLANMIFCGPNTSIVEFHFVKNPPMMFWHTAQALSMVWNVIIIIYNLSITCVALHSLPSLLISLARYRRGTCALMTSDCRCHNRCHDVIVRINTWEGGRL